VPVAVVTEIDVSFMIREFSERPGMALAGLVQFTD
jgi:hypothetical protein